MTEKNTPILSPEYLDFRNEITSRIRSPQYEALKAVNKEMIALYWEIGRRITEQQAALGWGKSVMENLSRYLQKVFPTCGTWPVFIPNTGRMKFSNR